MNIIFTTIEEMLSLLSQPMKRNLIFSFQNMKKLSEIVLKYIKHIFVLKIWTTGSFCLACFTGWSLWTLHILLAWHTTLPEEITDGCLGLQ